MPKLKNLPTTKIIVKICIVTLIFGAKIGILKAIYKPPFLSASIASRFYISIFPTGYYLSFPRHFYQFKTFLNKSQHSIQNYFEHFRTFIEVTWFQINFESYVSKLIWISKLKIGHNLFVLIKLALLDWKPFQSCFSFYFLKEG